MATIYVDNQPYEVNADRDLLDQCLGLGFDLPYFCWHPAMGSVGACRQCAVKQFKDENDAQGRIVMACMTPASEGTRISIDDPEARDFRASIIEWLMENHPHDCPVCDEGGECHLQDMTVMTGHTYRGFRFNKRTFANQDLGPFINHEMNRCITCYRCVRFYRDYAGGRDLHAMASKNHVYFGRHADGPLESEFSGNLVEICPTGVFTDKSLKAHYTRKWDLQTAPSVCAHCGHGCNILPGERYASVRRIRNRYNAQVNGYFLCDRGRYGYEFVNGEHRIREARLREDGGEPRPARLEAVMEHIGLPLGDNRVYGLGSPRASLEANFALRTLVGTERFCAGTSPGDHHLTGMMLDCLRRGPAPSATLPEVEQADAVVVLGENVPDTAPRLALALRQSVRRKGLELADRLDIPRWQDSAVREVAQGEYSPVFVLTPAPTRLDDFATARRHAPEDLARLGFALAHALDPDAPPVTGLSGDSQALVETMAAALGGARRPLVVSGTGCGSEAVLQAAANVATALGRANPQTRISLVAPQCNSLGLALLDPRSLDTAVQAAEAGELDTLVVLETDLYQCLPRDAAARLLERAGHVVTVDCVHHDTAARSDVVLPAAAFPEGDGTLVNNEGRAQRFYRTCLPGGPVQESWRWLQALTAVSPANEAAHWHDLDEITAACAALTPELAGITRAAPSAGFRLAGQRVPRQPHRYSGRTAMHAGRTMHEPMPPRDRDSALAFSMEGYPGDPPGALIPRYWAPGWNSVQALNKFQSEVGGSLRGGDPGVRLLEPREQGTFHDGIPDAFEPRPGQWRIVPLHQVFGSEALSALSPPVASRAPAPHVALHPDDARSLGAGDGALLRVGCLDGTPLPLCLEPSLPRGVVGVPAGLRAMPGPVSGDWSTLEVVEPS